jgi:F-type H+-transporting ATPase subunit a
MLFVRRGRRGALWFSLPIILWDNGIHLFSSSRFNHGEAVAESNGNFYVINHHDGKIYKTDASGTLTEGADGYPTNGRPIDFQSQDSFLDLNRVFLMILLRLAELILKTVGLLLVVEDF